MIVKTRKPKARSSIASIMIVRAKIAVKKTERTISKIFANLGVVPFGVLSYIFNFIELTAFLFTNEHFLAIF